MFGKSNSIFVQAGCIAVMLAGTLIAPAGASASLSQTAPQAAPTLKQQLGSIKTINGNTITLTTDAGTDVTVNVRDNAKVVRVEPGQTNLADAATIQLSDLQVGDRILVRGLPSDDGKTFTAVRVVAMKRADVDAKHKEQSDDWQKRGIGGLVHSVDAASNAVTISVAAPGGSKTITVHTTKDTTLRRYAPDSVKFDDAKTSTLAEIQPGDQLRARGGRSADGMEFTAEEIVTGAFRNIAGTINSVDADGNTLSVMDLVTKKPVIVRITANTKLVKLSVQMAQGIAFRLKGQAGSTQGTSGTDGGAATPNGGRQGGGGRGGTQADFQQVVNRMPAAKLADLQKGDAVMIVSTQSANAGEVTAIEMVAGVEPILDAPNGGQMMTLSPWNLGGGAEGDIQN